MKNIKKLCLAAICTVLCYVLPLIFHSFGIGTMFSPMHFPVLLSGILCGPVYGAFCGLCGPIISSLFSGMPGPAKLITMIPELMVYGLMAGVLWKAFRPKNALLRSYTSLIPAMLAGRIVGGIVSACVYITNANTYSLAIWAASYVVGTFPGIIAQLIVLPTVVIILKKTGVFDE